MPFDPTPTALFPNATNGDDTLVLNTSDHGSPSVPELSSIEAHVATGDLRKILFAIAEQANAYYLSLAAVDRPAMMEITKVARTITGSNQQRTVFTFTFTTDTTAEVADEI